MAPPFIVRPAEPRDVPALGNLGALLLRTHHAFDPRRFLAPGEHPEEGYARFLRGELDDPNARILVAEMDAEVVGYVFAAVEPMSWKELREAAGFVHDVAVTPEARRHRVAELLMEAAIEWLRTRHVPRILLWTAPQNLGALRLFEKLGFRPTMIEMTREV
jgi:ribosomal protein S18 acetylase RimI-like enzyme